MQFHVAAKWTVAYTDILENMQFHVPRNSACFFFTEIHLHFISVGHNYGTGSTDWNEEYLDNVSLTHMCGPPEAG